MEKEELKEEAYIKRFLENKRFMTKFEVQNILGKGGFGIVYKVKYLLDNNVYAIKKVKLHLGISETLHEHNVYREI